MSLRITEIDGVRIAKFLDSKYLDDEQIQKVGRQLMENVQDGVKIVLDFSGVVFISSVMIGKLVMFNKAVQSAKGKWAMYGVCRGVMEPFYITRLHKVFTIVEDEQAALKHVNGKSTIAW